MSNYFITQNDLLLLHTSKLMYCNVYLLNENNTPIDKIDGYIMDGSGSDDSESDIRKTCNFTIHSYDSTYDIGKYNRIWLNNRVRIDLGFGYFDNIYWYVKGTYVFDSCNYTYDGDKKSITFSCSDLVNTINGSHNGIVIGECPICKIPIKECEHRRTLFPNGLTIEGCKFDEKTNTYTGNDIKNVVEDILKQAGIKEFKVDTIGQVSCLQGYAVNWKQNRIDTGTTKTQVDKDELNGTDDLKNDSGSWHMIPYDLEFDIGSTLWDVLSKIRDLYSGYEMYFDKDGMFIFQLIPICNHDDNLLDFTQFDGLVLSESNDIDLSTVRNAIQIYGQNIEADRFSEKTSVLSTTYDKISDQTTQKINVKSISAIFETTFVYKGNIIVGIVFPDTSNIKTEDAYITINNKTYPIMERKSIISEDSTGIAKNSIEYHNVKYSDFNSTDMYCFKFLNSKEYWIYAGMYQIEGYAENNASDSPFSIENIGYRLHVCKGGEYEDIPTSTLANERAEYELWLKSRLNDSITLDTVIIPFLEVNNKIQYKKLSDSTIDSYIIKKISYSFTNGTMKITMSKFYELDPFIVHS